MPEASVRREFPWAAVIEWRYQITEHGMPPSELLKSMYALEDQMERQIEGTKLALLAMTRTGNGLRRWTYYVSSRKVAENEMAALVKASEAETVRLSVVEEPDWTALRDVLSRVQTSK